MWILTLDKGGEWKGNKFLKCVKSFSNKIFDFCSTKEYYNDEMWVDTRSQTERHLDKTGEMYELEQENAKKEAERLKIKN